MKTNTKQDIYAKVTESIIAQMEQGIIPWQRPWDSVGNGSLMRCISHSTGKPYSLLNQWLLNWKAGEWLTFGQIQAEGGRVKAGEKASMVVFWKYIERTKIETEQDEDGNEIEVEKVTGLVPILKEYKVFHIDQTEGIKAKYEQPKEEESGYKHEPIELAEQTVNGYINREVLKLFVEPSNSAFYRPSTDEVHVPEMKQYKVREEYYSTLFHELTHSTGHRSRLNRKEVMSISGIFGHNDDYSKEELVAEIGAAFLCQTVGIECEKAFTNSVAYLQNWLEALKNDKRMIVQAAAKAEAAVKYILNK